MMSLSVDIREGVYRQISRAARGVARNQQPDVDARAEHIAQGVVLKFTNRHLSPGLEKPAVWGAVHDRHDSSKFANRQLRRAHNEKVKAEDLCEERINLNAQIYPCKSVVWSDALELVVDPSNEEISEGKQESQ